MHNSAELREVADATRLKKFEERRLIDTSIQFLRLGQDLFDDPLLLDAI
ncbi:MAG: hypothetical protein SGJ09_09605 [Phycisphaerae bacterium]|nr:hypothetical protein [Phycisphaerae bacterium]